MARTREQFRTEIHDMLTETIGLGGFGRPQQLDRFIDRATDDVASLDCWYDVQATDLVAEQSPYCVPGFYKVKSISILDINSQHAGVRVFETPSEADIRYAGPGWRDDPSVDPPFDVVFEGPGRLLLHPAPSVARTGGLIIEGYRLTSGLWDAAGASCPLPDWALDCVLYTALKMRAESDPRSEVRARAAYFDTEARERRGRVERMAVQHHRRLRQSGQRWWRWA